MTADATGTPKLEGEPRGVNVGKAAPQKVKAADRRRMALALRIQGGSFPQIAEQLAGMEGISDRYHQGAAHRDVMKALEDLADDNSEEAEYLRELMTAQLWEIIPKFIELAKAGKYNAFDRLIMFQNQLLKLWGNAGAADRDRGRGRTPDAPATDGNQGPQIIVYIPDNGRGDRTPDVVAPQGGDVEVEDDE